MSSNDHQACTRCVMDTTAIEIQFDEHGVCSFCRRAERMLSKGWFPNDEGVRRLDSIAQEIRDYGKDKQYDCIIGMSGGIDSSYLLHVAKVRMGLRPLVVHVDAGWNSEIAVKNIESLIRPLGLDLFTYVVDWEEMRDLQLAFLRASVANQDIPQDHAFFAKLYELAVKKGIKYVLTGSNLTSESILPSSWGYKASDSIHLRSIHKRFGERKLRTFPTMSYFEQKIYWPRIRGMKLIKPLNLIDYDKEKAKDFLIKTYNWRYYGGKHFESKWTKFFQAYYLPFKFGYDKRKAHLSSLIIAGQLSREKALEELSRPIYSERELADDMAFIAQKLGISLAEFRSIIDLPPKTYKDYASEETLFGIRNLWKRAKARRVQR
jgi:N-acetyl sugar amidotransferase